MLSEIVGALPELSLDRRSEGLDRLPLVRRQVRLPTLGVGQQGVDRHGLAQVQVDYPCTPAFTASRGSDAQFPNAAGAGNLVARQRIL